MPAIPGDAEPVRNPLSPEPACPGPAPTGETAQLREQADPADVYEQARGRGYPPIPAGVVVAILHEERARR